MTNVVLKSNCLLFSESFSGMSSGYNSYSCMNTNYQHPYQYVPSVTTIPSSCMNPRSFVPAIETSKYLNLTSFVINYILIFLLILFCFEIFIFSASSFKLILFYSYNMQNLKYGNETCFSQLGHYSSTMNNLEFQIA